MKSSNKCQSSTPIRIIHWNCNGLLQSEHLQDVKVLLSEMPTVLCITETKLDQSCVSEVDIPGYQTHRADRDACVSTRNRGAGGGVLVYTPNYLETSWDHLAGADFEMGTLDFALPKQPGLRVVVIYRRPGNTATTALLDAITNAAATSKQLIVTGDINIDTLNSTPHPADLYDHLSTIVGKQLVGEPTRPASGTCLDHFWVSEDIACYSTASVMDNSGSDHLPILLSLKRTTARPKQVEQPKRLNWKAVPCQTIANFIRCYNWRVLLVATTLAIAMTEWNSFVDQLTALPPVTRPKLKTYITISHDVLSLMSQRDAARKEMGQLSPEYKALRNQVVQLIRKEKKENAERELRRAGNDSRKQWAVLNNILGRGSKSKTIPLLNASEANSFYCTTVDRLKLTRQPLGIVSIPPVTIDSIPPYIVPSIIPDPLQFADVPEHKIRDLLRSLKVMAAAGPDRMPSFIYKDFAFELAKPLTIIFNLSILECAFPASWKIAEVVPIYKGKGSKTDPASYRPVSLLCIAGKVLEKAIQLQLKCHFYTHGIIPAHQHGFRPNHSTTTCTASIANAIAENTENGKISALIALDFSKAFDTINHGTLLTTLKDKAMLSNSAVEWLQSYLTNRTQAVRIGDVLSKANVISAGVPQGSVLGPILFTTYTADMPLPRGGHIFMFADDTTLVISGNSKEDLETNCSEALANIEAFTRQMDLFLNIEKTQLVLCTSAQKRRHMPEISISGPSDTSLKENETATILGVTFDRHMTWRDHIKNQTHKAAGRCRAIARTGWMLHTSTLCKLLQALVFSITDYCDVTWADASAAATGPIDRVTNLAARIASHAPPRTPSAQLLENLGWLTGPQRRQRHRIQFCRKIRLTKCPADLHSLLPREATILEDERVTRSRARGLTKLPKIRTEYGRKTFKYWSSKVHNDTL